MKYKKLLLILASILTITSCKSGEEKATTTPPASNTEKPITKEEPTETKKQVSTKASGNKININFKPEFNGAYDEYKPLELNLNAPEYEISADLSNIENIDQFPNLSIEQKALIAKNGFVVSPTDSEQLFYIYEDNTYKKIPSFVTADSVLQLYHIFYDYSLRSLETDFFYNDLKTLNKNMVNKLMEDYENISDKKAKEAALKMVGYFGVSSMLLGEELPSNFPKEILPLVLEEVDYALKAEGILKSPLFGVEIDYSLFKVRGHYTRSDELGDYFKAMSWYGVVPMPLDEEMTAIGSIISTIALTSLPEEDGIKLWENIYSTTSFYVGESDDVTPFEIAEIIEKVYSDNPDMDEIASKLDEFYKEVENIRKPEIVSKLEGAEIGPQMRFMGQRYIPDSEVLQELSEPFKRPFPTGVDVFAVFGSERAEEILDQIYKPTVLWEDYQKNYDKMKQKFEIQTIPEQTKNLYSGWIFGLKSLTVRPEEGYPLFMQNTAWEDKSLNSALGSWSELRHDTILYGKQSGAECGGGMEPPELVGYVEPNPEFFNRMLWLTTNTKVNLKDRELLSEAMEFKLERFEEMLTFLRDCAVKELNGEDLSIEENYTLLTYGGTLEYLSSSIAEADSWFLVESDTDKNMAVIADIHNGGGSYLEVGVGTASEIYVAIYQYGKVYLTRGAVFDYFEFTSSERLTDEQWQEKIKTDRPERPPFTSSYMDEESAGEVPVPDEPYSTGC